MAEACVFLLERYKWPYPINVGSPEEVTILELAQMLVEVIGFKGKIEHDLSKPDGTPRKKTDLSKIWELGWKPKISLKEGLLQSYKEFVAKTTLREK